MPRQLTLTLVLARALIASCCAILVGCSETPAAGDPDSSLDTGIGDGGSPSDVGDDTGPTATLRTWRDVPYQDADGWAQDLANLDLYALDDGKLKDVAVFVHGGSWVGGDKGNIEAAPDLIDFFVQRGYLLASVNVRLFHSDDSPGAGYAEQATDIARAVKWLTEHASEYGGKTESVVLVGYSSGAHLVALTTTDARYLVAEGLGTDVIRGSISLDVPDYHVPTALALRVDTAFASKIPFLTQLFGASEEEQIAASPANYLDNPNLPPLLLVSAGIKDGAPQLVSNQGTADYKNRLLAAGHDVKHFHFPHREHSELVLLFNKFGDGVSAVVGAYLDRIENPNPSADLPTTLRANIDTAAALYVDASGEDSSLPTALVVGVVKGPTQAVLGYGAVTAGSETPPSPDDFFSIGSVSKLFTGLALANAEAGGTLSADDRLRARLAEPLGALVQEGITLRHLISHHSGLSNFPENLTVFRDVDGNGRNDSTPDSPARNYSLDHLWACFNGGGCQTATPPGSSYEYSNLGVGLLGIALADSAALSDFDQLHQAVVTWRVEMDDTGVLTEHFDQKTLGRAVQGYAPQSSGEVEPVSYPEMGVLASSGGLISTGRNMTSLLRVLTSPTGHSLAPAIATATEPVAVVEGSQSIAYAINIDVATDGTPRFYKGGVTAGYTAYITWRPSEQAGVVVLTNRGQFQAITELGTALLDTITAASTP